MTNPANAIKLVRSDFWSSARPTTPFDIAQDLSNSLEGWRLCEIMLPVGAPSSCAWNPFCSVPFEQFPPGHTIVRAMNGPTGVVFHACGAANVTPRDFRTLNGARELGPPAQIPCTKYGRFRAAQSKMSDIIGDSEFVVVLSLGGVGGRVRTILRWYSLLILLSATLGIVELRKRSPPRRARVNQHP